MLQINDDNLQIQSEELKSNLQYYNKLGKPLADEYTRDLDEKVDNIKNYLNQIRQFNLEFDIPSLQKILVDLSTTIYYTNESYEKLSLLEDMSKVRYKKKYNDSYLEKQGNAKISDQKYTVEQLRNFAESQALEEELINFIYSHAASTIKAKLDSANELLKSVSKILSSKIQEMSTFGMSSKYGS